MSDRTPKSHTSMSVSSFSTLAGALGPNNQPSGCLRRPPANQPSRPPPQNPSALRGGERSGTASSGFVGTPLVSTNHALIHQQQEAINGYHVALQASSLVDYHLANDDEKQMFRDFDSWNLGMSPSSQLPYAPALQAYGGLHEASDHAGYIAPSQAACGPRLPSGPSSQAVSTPSGNMDYHETPGDDTKDHFAKRRSSLSSSSMRHRSPPYSQRGSTRNMRHASTNDSTSTLTRNANDKRDSGFASIYTPSPKRSIDDLQSLHSTEYDNGLWFNDPTKRTMEPEPLLVLDGLIHVPQRVYIPHKSNANFTKIPSICCSTDDGRPMPLCRDNSQGAPAFAAKWEQHPATQSGTIGQKIQLRLEWPGYSSQYTSLNFRDFKKKSGPVAWEKFFERVTGAIRKMMQELEELKFNPEWSAWRVGKGYISPEDVVLLSIEHRSKGSWQPELYVRSRRDVHHPPLRHPTHPQYALQP